MSKEQQARSCAHRSNTTELCALFVFVFLVGALSGYAVKACILVDPPPKQEEMQ